MQYVLENEDTHRIKVVTVVKEGEHVPEKLADDLRFLDEAYPQMHIEFAQRKGTFGPELIQELSEECMCRRISCSFAHLVASYPTAWPKSAASDGSSD